jgi:ubiquinone/menaquinone biosynthesis C-methylase UbiE
MEPTTGLRDPTFRNYDTEQAVSFAKQRVGYSSVFYQVIIDHHVANGGELQTLIDVGCGSGAGTRGLATYFNHGIGIDPGKELILQARSIGGQTKMGKSIQYEVCSAEDMALSGVVEDDSVDLLSVGMAVNAYLSST